MGWSRVCCSVSHPRGDGADLVERHVDIFFLSVLLWLLLLHFFFVGVVFVVLHDNNNTIHFFLFTFY